MPLYFIAIPTPTNVTNQVRGLQEEFRDHFEAGKQLKKPVHITLIPPFKANEDQIEQLNQDLVNFSENKPGFQIELNGFGQFRKQVVFIEVVPNQILQSFQKELTLYLVNQQSIKMPKLHSTFNPHITLANRDLTRENFRKAWPQFKERAFLAHFEVSEIVLYKHDGKLWQVKETYQLRGFKPQN